MKSVLNFECATFSDLAFASGGLSEHIFAVVACYHWLGVTKYNVHFIAGRIWINGELIFAQIAISNWKDRISRIERCTISEDLGSGITTDFIEENNCRTGYASIAEEVEDGATIIKQEVVIQTKTCTYWTQCIESTERSQRTVEENNDWSAHRTQVF